MISIDSHSEFLEIDTDVTVTGEVVYQKAEKHYILEFRYLRTSKLND